MTREEAIAELKYARAMTEFNPMTGEVCFRNDEDKRQAEAFDMAIKALEQEPSIAPFLKVGRWILPDVEGFRIWHCNCSECGKDPQVYIYGSEDWWLIKNNLPRFCPTCGAKMEVKE